MYWSWPVFLSSIKFLSFLRFVFSLLRLYQLLILSGAIPSKYRHMLKYVSPMGDTVKSHFKALGLYNFIRGVGWAFKWGGLYLGGLISGIKKLFWNDKIKRI